MNDKLKGEFKNSDSATSKKRRWKRT